MDPKELEDKLKVAATSWSPILKVYEAFGGLSEFWAVVFGAAAIWLAIHGKLDGNFAGVIVAIQGLLCGHDAMDDWFRHKREQREAEK